MGYISNIWLHSINSVLVFRISCKLSKYLWSSALVAFLFAFHPLNVESVAWVSERKGLLAALFGLLSLWYYIDYVKSRRWLDYALVCCFFVLSLMSKTVLLAFPAVLICMDWWPLKRFGWGDSGPDASSCQSRHHCSVALEKIPLVLFSLGFFAVTYIAETQVGALKSSLEIPLFLRLGNALNSLVWYSVATFFPHNLSFYYLYPKSIESWKTSIAIAIVAGSVLLAIRARKQIPHLAAAFITFFFLILPVLGIVQIGLHARADRYMYLPMLALVSFVPGALHWSLSRKYFDTISVLLVLGLFLIFIVATKNALKVWRTNESLYGNALRLTPSHFPARVNLSAHLISVGQPQEALEQIHYGLTTYPDSQELLQNKAIAYYVMGKELAACEAFNFVLDRYPASFPTLLMLATLHLESKIEKLNSPMEAKRYAKRAVGLSPHNPRGWELLIRCYYACGQTNQADRATLLAGEALSHTNQMIRLMPTEL